MEILLMVHVTLGKVNICSKCISQIKGVYMDPIKVRVHYETNL